MFELAGTVVFVAWLILTVLNQFNFDFNIHFRRHDHGHLIPRWTFFAPNPGTADYHIVYRDLDADGAPCGGWIEVPIPIRSSLALVWNPQKRSRKVVTDMSQSLLRIARVNELSATVSIPYLAMLQLVVTHAPPQPNGTQRQFAIVQTFGREPTSQPVLIYRSALHPFAEVAA